MKYACTPQTQETVVSQPPFSTGGVDPPLIRRSAGPCRSGGKNSHSLIQESSNPFSRPPLVRFELEDLRYNEGNKSFT
jgi:hypothetical protein